MGGRITPKLDTWPATSDMFHVRGKLRRKAQRSKKNYPAEHQPKPDLDN